MAENDLDPTAQDELPLLSPQQEAEISTLLAQLKQTSPQIPADVAATLDAAIAAEVAAREALARTPSADETSRTVVTTADLRNTQPELTAESTGASAAATTSVSVDSNSVDIGLGTSLPRAAAATPRQHTRTKTLFTVAASIAALALLIGRPWVHDSGDVVASGPTRSAADTPAQQRGGATLAIPEETMVQVSRHSYQRSSLAKDVEAFLAGQGSGTQVRASAAPKEWAKVTQCVARTLAVLGAQLTSKVDLGWLDGKPSAIVVISDSATGTPATQVRVMQELNGKCTIAASASLSR